MKVAFVCTENTGLSQMAAAFARRLVGEGVIVLSGGTKPAVRVNLVTLVAMREVGIDISREVPRLITREELEGCDHVVTMGSISGGTDPCSPRGLGSNWSLPATQWKPLAELRSIRNEIEVRVQALLKEIGRPGDGAGGH